MSTETEQDTSILDALDFTPQCTSTYCEDVGRGAHDADYIGIVGCGHTFLWCSARYTTHLQDVNNGQNMVRCDDAEHGAVIVARIEPIQK